ncbi:gamma-glutamylcyclotransferase family protein [Roseimaritima sediminicola]|uniref:gamma-glutamylcyclotransferase family protein n=1 Tax=Roseimaritima sediminicola TaxID=2662066 RepID=UPI0012982476|nr:gamma-glutamylcyclotransferase family protein [Roseimaritima sediminicola]
MSHGGEDEHSCCYVFVYGTLKRGQCRQRCWPREPVAVETGFIRGGLLDLGAYPGLLPGEGWVRGELWEFEEEDLPETLRVLDAIEGYAAGDPDNLYGREVVPVYAVPEEGEPTAEAYTYFYADLEASSRLAHLQPIAGRSYVEWI